MNDLETRPASVPSDLPSDHERLQNQLNLLVIAMIILSGSFGLFLFLQTHYYRRDLGALKPMAGPIIQRFNQEKPTVDAFVAKVAEYSRTHPDFAPIAKKYQLQNVTNAPVTAIHPAPPAANKTAPAPAPATKK